MMRATRPISILLALAGLALAGAGGAAPPRTSDGFLRASPDFRFEFPKDHFAHDGYQIEWWYFTGHLENEPGPGAEARPFGYQFTFFRIGLAPDAPESGSRFAADSMIMGHAAITDLREQRHRFADVILRASPLAGGFGRFEDAASRRVASCPARGVDAVWTLDWNGSGFDFSMVEPGPDGFEISLSTKPYPDWTASPLLQGEHGFSQKTPDGEVASLYYSFPRLATTGTIAVAGTRFDVSGSSWMDHEISSDQLSDAQVGWDWFSLKFEDGRDVMLYRLRAKDPKDDYLRGTIATRGADPRYLGASAIALTPRRVWKSERTDAAYPVEWEVVVDGETLRIEPMLDAAENVARTVPNVHYWEGPVWIYDAARKRRLGVGYVELTGYGENARLPL